MHAITRNFPCYINPFWIPLCISSMADKIDPCLEHFSTQILHLITGADPIWIWWIFCFLSFAIYLLCLYVIHVRKDFEQSNLASDWTICCFFLPDFQIALFHSLFEFIPIRLHRATAASLSNAKFIVKYLVHGLSIEGGLNTVGLAFLKLMFITSRFLLT